MNIQEIFDTVSVHLLTQNEKVKKVVFIVVVYIEVLMV